MPLSSQTRSSGIGSPRKPTCTAALTAPAAVEWFAEASPKLQTTTASRGYSPVSPSLRTRSIENAMPRARGRWLAIVDVCGSTARSRRPNTLCRPPEMGSPAAATTPSSTSRTGSEPPVTRPARQQRGAAGEVAPAAPLAPAAGAGPPGSGDDAEQHVAHRVRAAGHLPRPLDPEGNRAGGAPRGGGGARGRG